MKTERLIKLVMGAGYSRNSATKLLNVRLSDERKGHIITPNRTLASVVALIHARDTYDWWLNEMFGHRKYECSYVSDKLRDLFYLCLKAEEDSVKESYDAGKSIQIHNIASKFLKHYGKQFMDGTVSENEVLSRITEIANGDCGLCHIFYP